MAVWRRKRIKNAGQEQETGAAVAEWGEGGGGRRDRGEKENYLDMNQDEKKDTSKAFFFNDAEQWCRDVNKMG